MTVAELIEALEKIENKNKQVTVDVEPSYGTHEWGFADYIEDLTTSIIIGSSF